MHKYTHTLPVFVIRQLNMKSGNTKSAIDNRHNKNTLYKYTIVPYLPFSEQCQDIHRH